MNTRKFAFLFCAVVSVFMSCKNKDLLPATPLITDLNVVNATSDTIKYFINGTRQNDLSSIYVGGQTAYQQVISGTQNYKIADATGSFPVLFSTEYTLTDSAYYSLFVAGATADKAFLSLDPIAAANTTIDADTTGLLSVIRFVNASPSVGSLNVTVGTGDTVNITNAAFKYVGSYLPFTSGTKEVKVYPAGSTTAVVDTTITFVTHNVYTLFTHGQLNGKGVSAFSVTLTN